MLPMPPNYTHLGVLASLPTLVRHELSVHRILSQICLPTFLLDYLFAHTPMQMVPSVLLPVLPPLGFDTYTLHWS